ncbi:hypothetical protein AABH71_003924 [Salmonella enterica]|nr:hypothetical protein [Salmonella enterica subsp. enterica]EDT5577357.1 hypothetical protein [Salmonella enterica subsp. enterica serovar Kokomlemle]EDX3938347.1 hypothetical protein [Salmonella enterica subsp. enterica serovar Overschie]EEB7410299.1 hypothetical protein [Salmonella enterica]EHI8598565.1 hypothetical protein [Salmonella enterica subsp. enterica serovar 51:z:1,5]
MSVGIDDAMVQWDAILHTDLHIAEIRYALKAGAPVSLHHWREVRDKKG